MSIQGLPALKGTKIIFVTIQPYINVIGRLNSIQICNCTHLSNTFGIDGYRLSIKNKKCIAIDTNNLIFAIGIQS